MSHHDRRRAFQQRQALQAAPPSAPAPIPPDLSPQIRAALQEIRDNSYFAARAAEDVAMYTGYDFIHRHYWS